MSPDKDPASASPMQAAHPDARKAPALVSVSIQEPLVLQRCYLPFFRHGGLFVPGNRPYQLGQRLFLILRLPAPPGVSGQGAGVVYATNATVAWLSPAQAQNGGRQGVGLHFDAGRQNLKRSLESLLKALL